MNKEDYDLIIGRHISMTYPNFLVGAIHEALSYEANALAIYVGSPQSNQRRPIPELKIKEFKNFLKENRTIDIKNIIVHAPHVMNLGNILNQNIFYQSIKLLKAEIRRMVEIGLETIVLHPGNALNAERSEAIKQIVRGINLVLEDDPSIRIALETMCGKGTEIGVNFQELNSIIQQVKYKKKIGICWDTCHMYSAGYNFKDNLEEIINEFDKEIGLDKLWVIHLNDSYYKLGTRKEKHENIGYGQIGWNTLHKIVWHPKFSGIAKILETPKEKESHKEEIRMLKSC
ncbi:deoxyribonuclease IV [endosymbiont GvMRE of Glomus versiforme]|uniref:deoxyribonuclease IV n=1 Tax=endosymbiont GvMRE of Glomus versiforme TaxID=2039283 RepID=UPI000EEB2F48|nr:deoxyribonuclease IV [endosymbiont GvMRE of Glomus versiforme]RHZ35335.1 Deoxyribonuclease IV [endosymbiont GvMRE of Glomus versiforme]